MSTVHASDPDNQETPVDEVRAVRERRDRQAGGDVRKLIEESRRIVDRFRDELDLKVVAPPPPDTRRDGTGG